MADWCMAHPWLTFIICIVACGCVSGMGPFVVNCNCKGKDCG